MDVDVSEEEVRQLLHAEIDRAFESDTIHTRLRHGTRVTGATESGWVTREPTGKHTLIIRWMERKQGDSKW